MTRLTFLEVENFKKLVKVAFPIKGVTELSGHNGAGKSSAIDSLAVLLDGLKVAPAEPIRQGAQRSRIRGRIGEMSVIRYIDPKKDGGHTTKIMFEPIDGKAYPATQRQLDDLIGEHSLDPIDFLNLDSKGMFAAFQTFVVGFDFAKGAREDAADTVRRTEVGRLAKESRAAANMIMVPDGTPAEPDDESALVRELREAGEKNAAEQQRSANRVAAVERVAALRTAAEDAEANIESLKIREAKVCDETVAELERQIGALQLRILNTRTELSTRIQQGSERLRTDADAKRKEADELQARIEAARPIEAPTDTAAIEKRISKARETNAAVTRAAERTRHSAVADKYETEWKDLTEGMNARRAAKEAAVAAAKLPVKGLDFGDGEIRLNGQLFEQASTAERLRVAFGYIVAKNPQLRLAWIRDASLLDDDSYAEIHRLAEEFQCDVLIETVRPIGKDAIVLENGMLKARPHVEEGAAA